jgi:hypothetical protein
METSHPLSQLQRNSHLLSQLRRADGAEYACSHWLGQQAAMSLIVFDGGPRMGARGGHHDQPHRRRNQFYPIWIELRGGELTLQGSTKLLKIARLIPRYVTV